VQWPTVKILDQPLIFVTSYWFLLRYIRAGLYIFKLGLPPCTYRKHYQSSTKLHIMTTRSSIPQKRRKEDDDQDEIVKDGRLTTAAENFFEAVCM
jgi:hypothetical protein